MGRIPMLPSISGVFPLVPLMVCKLGLQQHQRRPDDDDAGSFTFIGERGALEVKLATKTDDEGSTPHWNCCCCIHYV